MKKIFSTAVLSFSMMLFTPTVSYGGGAGAGAGTAMLQSIMGAAGSAAYAGEHFSQCGGWGSWYHCVQGAMGVMQLLQMLKGADNSYDAAITLGDGLGDFTFDPTDAGVCFDPTCSPDAIDTALKGFSDAFQTGEGYDDAIAAMKAEAEAQLAAMEKKGYKVDAKAGVITGPGGKSFKMSDFKGKMSSKLSKALADKMQGVEKAIGNKRSVASASGKKGGVIFKDEYIGGLSGNFGKKKSKKSGNSKGEFLAGLSDKDAGLGGIGFAGDSIFGMIKRRYSKKLKAKEFISN